MDQSYKVTQAAAYLICCLFGFYSWELWTTIHIEWSFIVGGRRLKFPLAPFFICRYSIFLALLCRLLSVTVRSRLDCQTLFVASLWLESTAISSASITFVIRMMALWEYNLAVVIPFSTFSLGHCAIRYLSVFSTTADWNITTSACKIASTLPRSITAAFLITPALDLATLVLTTITLKWRYPLSSGTALWTILLGDDVIFVIISLATNITPAVLSIIDQKVPFKFIATLPAAMAMSFAACRAVIRIFEVNTGAGDLESTASVEESSN